MPARTTTHELALDGATAVALTSTEHGTGLPVLLLHGGAGPQSMLDFADDLARAAGVRVIVPVHPGFGGTPTSDAPDSAAGLAGLYIRLLDELDLTDVTVIGNSLGGWIAAEMALTTSPRIARMVLLDATGIDAPDQPITDLSTKTVPEIMQLSFHNPLPFIVDPATLTRPALDIAAGNRAALQTYSGSSGTDPTLLRRLSQLDLATMVIWGESDNIATTDYGRTMAAAIPDASFIPLPGAGHAPQVETPEQVITHVAGFMRSTAAWEHDYSENTTVSPAGIWAALRDLYSGVKLGEDGDDIVLHGEFTVGTGLSVTPHGADFVVQCVITKLDEGAVFAYRSLFNGLYLTSRHTLRGLRGGGTRIIHHSQIAGPRADTAGLTIGPRITDDRAETMRDLIAAGSARPTP